MVRCRWWRELPKPSEWVQRAAIRSLSMGAGRAEISPARDPAARRWRHPIRAGLAMGSRGDRRLPERDGTADVPPWSGAGGEGSLQVRRVFDRRYGRWRVKAQGQNRATGREGCNGRRAAGLPCQDGAGITAHILRTARSAVGGVFPLRCWLGSEPLLRPPTSACLVQTRLQPAGFPYSLFRGILPFLALASQILEKYRVKTRVDSALFPAVIIVLMS